MSFFVTIRQYPIDMDSLTITSEMSMDTMQLKLIKEMDNVLAINGVRLTKPQKESLVSIGERWDVTDVRQGDGGTALVTARREGHMRVWVVRTDGDISFMDGMGPSVYVSRQDPLGATPWLLTDVVE